MNTEAAFHVIKDPVHGTMQFTTTENNWIKPFIDSPPFQRLRHIKQMGMGDYIFPGAVHTRFNHCLGCCYIASQITKKIGLSEEERQLVMIACLLHDIGHGPFSHTFEDLFQDKLIRHEVWTPFFLADYRNKIFFDEYNRVNPRYPLTEEKFSLIEEMIMHKSSGRKLLADIVSSQLDADRLDYLLRDSHFCGVTYGQFDFRWMLHSMQIVNSKDGECLGLNHKGIGVVEHYLMARRLMIRNIYQNHKKLALEFFLIQLLSNLAENLEENSRYAGIKNSLLGNFLINVNQFNREISSATPIESLKQRFLEDNYCNYKELCDYDVFAMMKSLVQINSNDPAIQIAQRLQGRHMPTIVRLNQNTTIKLEEHLVDFRHAEGIQDWQLAIIKMPHQSYTIQDDPIHITNEEGNVQPLNEISLIINAMSDKREQIAFLCVDKAIVSNSAIEQFIKDFDHHDSCVFE